MIELKRNKKTGKIESWKNGKKIGEITSMGEEIKKKKKEKKG